MPHVISLPPKLDTTAAPGLLQDIKAARGTALTLDASGSRGLGAICAQILLAAHAAWRSDGVLLAVTGAAGLADDARLLGLSDLLNQTDTAS